MVSGVHFRIEPWSVEDALQRAARQIGRGCSSGLDAPSSEEFALVGRELEEMSVRLNEARRLERALDASHSELVAWVSHDLSRPLASIGAVFEALEAGVADDPAIVSGLHPAIRAEVDWVAGLVDDLFELIRIPVGPLQRQVERVSPSGRASDARGRHTWESGANSCGSSPPEDIGRVFDTAFRGVSMHRRGGCDGGAGVTIADEIPHAHNGETAVANEAAGRRFAAGNPLGDRGRGA